MEQLGRRLDQDLPARTCVGNPAIQHGPARSEIGEVAMLRVRPVAAPDQPLGPERPEQCRGAIASVVGIVLGQRRRSFSRRRARRPTVAIGGRQLDPDATAVGGPQQRGEARIGDAAPADRAGRNDRRRSGSPTATQPRAASGRSRAWRCSSTCQSSARRRSSHACQAARPRSGRSVPIRFRRAPTSPPRIEPGEFGLVDGPIDDRHATQAPAVRRRPPSSK